MVNIKVIKEKRQQLGYSQQYMAQILGEKSKSTYCRKENGMHEFSVKDIVKLCDVFRCDLCDLIIR